MTPDEAFLVIQSGQHKFEESLSPYHISVTWHDDKPLWRVKRYLCDVRADIGERFQVERRADVNIIHAGSRCAYVKFDIILPQRSRNNTFFFHPGILERLRRVKARYEVDDMMMEGNGKKIDVWDPQEPSNEIEMY